MTSFVRAHGENVYRALFAEADLLVANCEYFRNRAIELGAPAERVIVIGSAVDCTAFAPRTAGTRPTLPDDDPLRLLAIGRLVQKKGFDDAIRAVADVAGDLPGIHLEIIGDGPLHDELAALARQLGVEEQVTLAGSMSHDAVVERLAASDLLLAPSVTASSGDQDAPVNSLKEAMAMELPVIGTRHGGIPELVDEGCTGALVPEHDHRTLADAIRRADANRAAWRQMGRSGRRRILAEYDLPVVTDRLVTAYRSLLESSGAAR